MPWRKRRAGRHRPHMLGTVQGMDWAAVDRRVRLLMRARGSVEVTAQRFCLNGVLCP